MNWIHDDSRINITNNKNIYILDEKGVRSIDRKELNKTMRMMFRTERDGRFIVGPIA